MTAIGAAFRVAWNLSKQLGALELSIVQNNAAQTQSINSKIDEEIGKIDERLRHVENDLARMSPTVGNHRH